MTLKVVRFKCTECGNEIEGASCCEDYCDTILADCEACDNELVVEYLSDLTERGLVVSVTNEVPNGDTSEGAM